LITPAFARTLARYNAWMNERIYAICSSIADDERKKDVGAFFKSIHGTLNHLLLADRIWMGRFQGSPYKVGSLSQELYSDFEELHRERAAMDKSIGEWAETLTPEALAADLHYVSITNPAPRSTPLGLTVAHFFNHQTHHRGQLTTLLMQRGIDPGVTDLLWLPPEPAR